MLVIEASFGNPPQKKKEKIIIYKETPGRGMKEKNHNASYEVERRKIKRNGVLFWSGVRNSIK